MAIPTGKTPWHLWLVGVLAFLFNAYGGYDYVMTVSQGESYMAGVGMTADQIAHVRDMPAWMTADWAIGVWGAILASVLLLLRRKLAGPVFIVSLAAYLISLFYTYVLTNGGEIMGQTVMIMNAVIAAVLVFLVWYSLTMTRRGVLR